MKNLQHLLLYILILSGGLASCNNENRHYSTLLALEDSIHHAPDKTIEALESMDTTRLSRKEKALYHIVLARGLELSNNRIVFYRVVTTSFLVIFALIAISYRKEQRKRKLEQQLKNEQFSAMEIRAKQQEIELQLSTEREKREKIEIEKLNQTINYYKSLNAITIPVLLKSQKGAMLHLTEKEWEIVARNTNACFNGFTERLQKLYPQLTEEEIRFCYLIKMELSISLLAQIYHIAGGSVSRKKMRLKEKMGIGDISLDEFIQAF